MRVQPENCGPDKPKTDIKNDKIEGQGSWIEGFYRRKNNVVNVKVRESLKFLTHHGEDGQLWYYFQYHACIGRFNGVVTYHAQQLFQNIMVSHKIW